MSNALIAPAAPASSDCLTEIIPTVPIVSPVPTRRSILRAPAESASASAQPERSPFAGWRGRAQTEEMPTIAAHPRVSTQAEPTGSRVARRTPASAPHVGRRAYAYVDTCAPRWPASSSPWPS